MPHRFYKSTGKMKLMENNAYGGNLYFVGVADVLDFQNFCFDEALQIIEFDFYCDESKSGSYGHKGTAKKTNGHSYATERFSPHKDRKSQAQLQFDSELFRFLSDDQGEQFLYVKGTWYQGSKKRIFHGLLKCKGQGSPHIYRKSPAVARSSQLMETMRHFAYGGDMYFVGAIDVLNFHTFRFDEDQKIIEFNFSSQKPKSESYRHEGIAEKSSGSAYRTERFSPYEVSESTVQLVFNPADLQYFADRSNRPFLYVQGSWHEGNSEWVIHGLLLG